MSVSTSDGVAEEVLGRVAAADMVPDPVGPGRWSWRRWRPHPSLLLVLVLGLLVVPPLVIMVWQSFNSDPILGREGPFNAYKALAESTDLARSGKGTLIFSVGSSVCALVFGMTLAWLVARTDMPVTPCRLHEPAFAHTHGWRHRCCVRSDRKRLR